MNAVIEHGTPLVDDPGRIGAVTPLGWTRLPSFGPTVNTHQHATGLVDLRANAGDGA